MQNCIISFIEKLRILSLQEYVVCTQHVQFSCTFLHQRTYVIVNRINFDRFEKTVCTGLHIKQNMMQSVDIYRCSTDIENLLFFTIINQQCKNQIQTAIASESHVTDFDRTSAHTYIIVVQTGDLKPLQLRVFSISIIAWYSTLIY